MAYTTRIVAAWNQIRPRNRFEVAAKEEIQAVLRIDSRKIRNPERIQFWANTIYRRTCGRLRAEANAIDTVPLTTPDGEAVEVPAPTQSASSACVQNEKYDELNTAIEQLPDQLRCVVSLRLDGLSHVEIARRMKLEPATVRAYFFEAKAELRRNPRLRNLL